VAQPFELGFRLAEDGVPSFFTPVETGELIAATAAPAPDGASFLIGCVM